jgi:hypothetical protein
MREQKSAVHLESQFQIGLKQQSHYMRLHPSAGYLSVLKENRSPSSKNGVSWRFIVNDIESLARENGPAHSAVRIACPADLASSVEGYPPPLVQSKPPPNLEEMVRSDTRRLRPFEYRAIGECGDPTSESIRTMTSRT